jgi:hypothetical protein
MHIKFKVVRVDPHEHSVLIRTFTEKITEEMLAQHDGFGNIARLPDGSPVSTRTDLYVNIPVPPPADLQAWLLERYGRHCDAWLELQEKIADPNVDTSLQSAASLAGKVMDAPPPPPPTPTPGRLPAGAVELRARRDKTKQIGTTIL